MEENGQEQEQEQERENGREEEGRSCLISTEKEEGSIESHRYYLSRRTTLEMLKDRGYSIPSSETNLSLSEFRAIHGHSPDVDRLRFSATHSSNPSKRVRVSLSLPPSSLYITVSCVFCFSHVRVCGSLLFVGFCRFWLFSLGLVLSRWMLYGTLRGRLSIKTPSLASFWLCRIKLPARPWKLSIFSTSRLRYSRFVSVNCCSRDWFCLICCAYCCGRGWCSFGDHSSFYMLCFWLDLMAPGLGSTVW